MSTAIVVSVVNILCVLSCIMYMCVFYIWARSLTQINKLKKKIKTKGRGRSLMMQVVFSHC